MPNYDNIWHIDTQENVSLPDCLIVFVKSKTENQLIRFVIAYSVADNNVKCETVIARKTPNFITPDLWPPNSPDLNPVDYRICGVLQERIYRKSANKRTLMK